MKSFDERRAERAEKERGFIIGGEKFVRRVGVRPEDIIAFNQATGGESVPTEEEWIAIYDETVLACIEPGQEELWAKVRAERENPLTVHDLLGLISWLMAEVTGRPTGASTDSSAGRDSTGTTSTDGSSSRELAAVPGS